ncbi:crossover junction endonuclease eme1 [Fusarium austroafricanum]|uniref:Crossover junction endonuclease eme1 n=1 Tax=Fusarium austroafricanum TaxID=2364996 RepID=A0A8H4KK72_9HYPO|nr:crossover junction endonuclease eme1 [Fusarium austroafricanum]
MAPDVIDLISSSPPPSHSIPPSAQIPESSNTVEPEKQHPPVIDVTNSASLSFLSDDFDTTIDLNEPILIEANPNKRRRLSPPAQPPPLKRISPVPEPRVILPPVRTNGNARAPTADDTIELTSSPGLESPGKMRPSTYTSTKPVEQTIEAEDSDPFASSPQPMRRSPPKPNPAARPVESLNPFASSPQIPPIVSKAPDVVMTSPPAPAPKPKPAARPVESSDPFASSPQIASIPSKALDVIITSPPAPVSKPPPKKNNAAWDPISSSAPDVFSFDSSPPRKSRDVINIDDSDGEEDSEDELPDLASFDVTKIRRRSQLQRSQSDVVSSRSRAKPTASRKSIRSNTKSVEERAREKEAKAVAKEVEKEAKRREKQEAKEAKLREKERTAALAEVNKLRTDKKISTPEMMVDIPSSLNSTVTTQLQTMLEPLDVQYTTWDSPVDNVIKWRRKVRSQYNDEIGLWEPIPLRLEDEKHALVVMHADEFVKLVLDDEISSHVARMQVHFADYHKVYLIEGLTPWMRKNRSLRNRQFASNVRAQEASTSTSTTGRRRNKPPEEYVSEELIEDALLQLQVMHDALIHHTMIPIETAEQIVTFTQHISTIPYRKQKDLATLGAGFCMESGQVKTGDDAKDTYVKMLQEIVRVTAPIAYGVAMEFDTVSGLVRGLEEAGPSRLEGVRKSANKDGAFSDRTVGQAVSRRMYKVFTGVDETSTDV